MTRQVTTVVQMPLDLEVQRVSTSTDIPGDERFQLWVDTALAGKKEGCTLVIRIVDEMEARCLNRDFRDRDYATNVLAFPGASELLDYDCLGDLVICAPVVAAEAEVQGKSLESHWAHLVIHGMLHLQGFDHQDAAQTRKMETLEIKILDGLGYNNPYI